MGEAAAELRLSSWDTSHSVVCVAGCDLSQGGVSTHTSSRERGEIWRQRVWEAPWRRTVWGCRGLPCR